MGATIELELSSGVWTDVSADVLARVPVKWSRGIMSSGPQDLVARPGAMSFALLNSAANSANTAGYYSPGHANVRSGFGHGTRARLKIDAGGGVTARYVFMGRLRNIAPSPGTTGKGATFCVAEDWLAEFADYSGGASELALVESQRSDQLIQDLIDLMDTAPATVDLDTGLSTFPFAFDDLGDQPQLMSIAQDIVQSEGFGFLFLRGDNSTGETLKLQNRHARAKASSVLTLAEGSLAYDGGITVPSSLDRIFNTVETAIYPRRVDSAATTVLVSLDTSVEIGVGETVTILADYRDPANLASHVGGKDCVTPVASTDYTGNTAADGTGSNITSDLDLSTTSFLGSRASIKAENNGTVTAYLRGPGSEDGMQIRGKGLYSGYQPIYSLAENSTSIASFGNRNLPSTMDLPLNSSQAVGAGAAEFLANLYGDIQNIPTKCRPLTEIPATLQACIVLDVGDKISISETQTAASAEVFINGVEGEVNGPTVRMTWTLAPASTVSVLILNDAVAGKLDSNALGYV
jgi:hypothetical protein